MDGWMGIAQQTIGWGWAGLDETELDGVVSVGYGRGRANWSMGVLSVGRSVFRIARRSCCLPGFGCCREGEVEKSRIGRI